MSNPVSIEVPASLEGERLDRSLSLLLSISRSQASKLIAEGSVLHKGKTLTAPATRLASGATLRIDAAALENLHPKLTADPNVPIEIVHEDTDLLVLEKAPNVVVHPGSGNATGTLAAGLLARFPEIAEVGEPDRPGIVHRLDKGTSGLMAVARTAKAYETLIEMFSEHRVRREYLALCHGVPQNDQGTIDAPIGRSPRRPTEMAITASGRDAITHYEVMERLADIALIKCQLETGRTHQIRVHLAAIGHPLLGDTAYGKNLPKNLPQDLPDNLSQDHSHNLSQDPTQNLSRNLPENILPIRPALHSSRLALTHPTTSQPLSFSSPLPTDLAQLLLEIDRV